MTSNREKGRIIAGSVRIDSDDERFLRLLTAAFARPPASAAKIMRVSTIRLSHEKTKTTVGLTRYSPGGGWFHGGIRQTITFYSDLFSQLSDDAALGVIGHELAHAWLNEHVSPEESKKREEEADALAREWGFGKELDALDREAYTV